MSLDSGIHHNPNATIERLAELPGIGPWTAHYIAMRALRWPDAFPKEDIAVLNNLGGVTRETGGGNVASLAAMAFLCGAALVETPR